MSTQVSVQSQEDAASDKAQQQLEQLCINTIRTLSMDAVQKANSGHPGTPMALAPLAFVLWNRFLRHNPRDPHWAGRDRFVLSNGHASMLLYSMLFLTGYDLTLDDLKNFRQWGSKTPGHPEYGLTAGVETTTGPLGQGISNSVGMAIAQHWFASTYGRDGHDLFDYRTYAICGDGDLMEGVSNEAASIAGHLGLANLIWFYDNNHITIEGSTSLAFSDDVATRFLAWHWNVQHVGDVNDLARAGPGDPHGARGETAPDPDHREQPHRLGLSAQAGHGRGTWRTAGCGGNQAHQGVLRMAARRAIPGARRSQGLYGRRAGTGSTVGAGVGRRNTRLGRRRFPISRSSGR